MSPETREAQDVEPEGSAPEGGGGGSKSKKERHAFAKVRRELTDEDLASPAILRILLDDIDRLDAENTELKDFREGFYRVTTDLGIEKERGRKEIAAEVISATCFTLSGAVLGFVPLLWKAGEVTGPVALGIGLILFGAAIVAKAVRR